MVETIETERLTRLTLGNQTNVRHVVTAANDVNAETLDRLGLKM